MVHTHLPANALLVLAAFMPNATLAIGMMDEFASFDPGFGAPSDLRRVLKSDLSRVLSPCSRSPNSRATNLVRIECSHAGHASARFDRASTRC
jgi:hypothetical protein